MKKIKKIMALVLSLVMVLSLFGCGKDNNDVDETKGTDENNQVIYTNENSNSPYAEDEVLFVAQNIYDIEEDSHILHFYNYNGVHLDELDTSVSTVISLKNYAKNGLTPAMDTSNGKYGYINRDGSFIIDAKYDEAYSFSDDGLALVMCEEKYESAYNKIEKYGFINSKREEIIPCIYDCATSFYPSGYAIIGNCDFQINEMDYVDTSNYRYGVIDKNGEFIIEQKYEGIYPITGKYILCREENHKYVIYNTSGSIVYEFEINKTDGYIDCYTIGDDVFYTNANYDGSRREYYIFNGNEFVDYYNSNIGKYYHISDLSSNLKYVLKEINSTECKIGIAYNDEEVIPCEYDYIYSVKDYFVAVKYSTARGKIDIYNSNFEKTAEDLSYEYIDRDDEFGEHAELPNGYFCIGDGNDKYGIIDYTGRIIVEPIYENVGVNTYESIGKFDLNTWW